MFWLPKFKSFRRRKQTLLPNASTCHSLSHAEQLLPLIQLLQQNFRQHLQHSTASLEFQTYVCIFIKHMFLSAERRNINNTRVSFLTLVHDNLLTIWLSNHLVVSYAHLLESCSRSLFSRILSSSLDLTFSSCKHMLLFPVLRLPES